ncbi:N-acetyl-gamma-glutamyl-phosphate reductase [Treponema pectinovorum]|uniref:N-acetyl-gamma-glutamyl-phosphate reductase n=1 Tax=Treponema pectinovorum TaxID=164 RepID=UPI0011CAA667|nr:N-acetyl-gamma-glutamyl-phosphate reductase [Treponema pectinovorum]
MYKVFIDGKEGTTGLKIYERFAKRTDIEILLIDEEKRKVPAERAKMINSSDYTFLCLPDSASIEAVKLCTNPNVKIIDASTAHRTNPDWAYGFPELSAEHRKKIASSKRVAVPGCYASGFASLVYPLVKNNIISPDYPLVCHAVSGYSGAGKKAIEQYNSPERNIELDSPRLYALTQEHKHLPEMALISGLKYKPIFNPYICDYFSGMSVTVSIHTRLMQKKLTGEELTSIFKEQYNSSKFVKCADFMGQDILSENFIAANTLAGTNNMQIFICGNDERLVLTSRFDNLGKGASGAAVQCMNIMMAIDEGTGL